MDDLKQAVANYLNAYDAFQDFEKQNPNDATRRWDAVFDQKCFALDALRRVYQADPIPAVVAEVPAPKVKKTKEEPPFVLEYEKSGYVTTKETARLIRRILKESFLKTKFSVRSDSYSMGSHVNVSWEDGPTHEQVEAVIGEIAGKTFNGMDDSYDYHDHLWQGDRIHFAGSGSSPSRQLSDAKREEFIKPEMTRDEKDAAYRVLRATSYEDTTPSATLAMFRLYQPAKAAA